MNRDTISRQAAIEAIYAEARLANSEVAEEYAEVYAYALRGVPSAQPDVSDTNVGDMVSRQAVKDWILKWEGYIDIDTITRMQCRVIDIPSAQPEHEYTMEECMYGQDMGNPEDGSL